MVRGLWPASCRWIADAGASAGSGRQAVVRRMADLSTVAADKYTGVHIACQADSDGVHHTDTETKERSRPQKTDEDAERGRQEDREQENGGKGWDFGLKGPAS